MSNFRKFELGVAFLLIMIFSYISIYIFFGNNHSYTTIATTSFMIAMMCMQYIYPEQPNRFDNGEVLTDWLFFGFSFLFSVVNAKIIDWAIEAGQLIWPKWAGGGGDGLSSLPLWLEVVIFMLVLDLGYYVTHRLAHVSPLLFRFHSVHHTPDRISVLNSFRSHPIDSLWRRGVPMAIVLQLGFGHDAVAIGVVITITAGFVQHLNVDFRYGFVNRIFGTSEVHRWHHSTKLEEAQNFGLLTVWDQVFGTFVFPPGDKRPVAMGLAEAGDRQRHHFIRELLYPFGLLTASRQKPVLERSAT